MTGQRKNEAGKKAGANAAADADLVVQAPAKLNLYLDILGKRGDGFHEIETLIAPIGLVDTLRFRPNHPGDGQIHLRVHPCAGRGPGRTVAGDSVPADSSNLVVQALNGLRELLGVTAGVTVDLWKRIPSRAGLGGGSSDAAAALRAGLGLWAPEQTVGVAPSGLRPRVFDLAARLGSDVPAMLDAKPVICRGRGERLEQTSAPSGVPCVLVQPPVGLGAGEVFAELRSTEHNVGSGERLRRLLAALWAGRMQEAGRLMANSLRSPAERLAPTLARIRDAFAQFGVAAHQMSGSGTVYFGLCENWRTARRLAARLRQTAVGRRGWVCLAPTL